MESQHHRYKSARSSAVKKSLLQQQQHLSNTAPLSNGHQHHTSSSSHFDPRLIGADRSLLSPTTAAAQYRSATPSGRRRTLPELPHASMMSPSLPSPSYSQRSAQSDPKSVWSKSPYNRYNYASSNHSLSGALGLGGGSGPSGAGYSSALSSSGMHRYSSVPKLGSSKYREHSAQLSRSFDNFSSPTPGLGGGGSSIWLRPGSPFRNPSLYDRIRSRDQSLAKMYRNYLSNNDLVQRYSQSQPGSPLRSRYGEFGFGGGGGGRNSFSYRPTEHASSAIPFSSRSYRDLVESSKLRYDLTGSPASSSGYASWRGDNLPLLDHHQHSLHSQHHNPLMGRGGRFGGGAELSSVLTGSPTPSMSPARSQRLREIVARSNANYYNMRESYNRLHQIGPSPPMSPLGMFRCLFTI